MARQAIHSTSGAPAKPCSYGQSGLVRAHQSGRFRFATGQCGQSHFSCLANRSDSAFKLFSPQASKEDLAELQKAKLVASMAWDRVYTINDYYDGPRLGIADVDGVPHIYEAEFDYSSDEYGDAYFVSAIDEGLLPSSSKTGKFGCAGIRRLSEARSRSSRTLPCPKIARDMRS